jgi:hypothetical protein
LAGYAYSHSSVTAFSVRVKPYVYGTSSTTTSTTKTECSILRPSLYGHTSKAAEGDIDRPRTSICMKASPCSRFDLPDALAP